MVSDRGNYVYIEPRLNSIAIESSFQDSIFPEIIFNSLSWSLTGFAAVTIKSSKSGNGTATHLNKIEVGTCARDSCS